MNRRTIFSVILLISIALLLAISCSPDADINKGERLILISNVDENGNSTTRSIEGVLEKLQIHGVLLKFHSEGLYGRDSSCFKYLYDFENNQFIYPNAFYLEYLGKDDVTHYGMTFNYVLYVPDIIQNTYIKGHGVNPRSGNPFWWYMKTYYNKDLNMITNDWPSALWQLFLNKDGLEMPNSKDVTGFWNESYLKKYNVQYNGKYFTKDISCYYYDGISHAPDTFLYFEEPVRRSKYNDYTVHIVMPSCVQFIYFSGSGINDNSEAMIWYFETYYGVKKGELLKAYETGTLGALIKECTKKYGFIEPKSTDVDTILNVIDVTRNIDSFKDKEPSFANCQIYRAGLLKDENGNIIEDCDRIYFIYIESKNTLFIYLPEQYIDQMKKHCEEHNLKFSYSGDLIWNYIKGYCNPTSEEENLMNRNNNYRISARLIECLANYRASEGFVKQY